jgi:lycopene beta-cyclase
MKQYDYIFTGAGLSALMTVYKMVLSGKFQNKRILLLDENAKQTNDRTWCFWAENKSIWNSSVSKKWGSALFANADFQLNLELHPYQYNKIQGLDL